MTAWKQAIKTSEMCKKTGMKKEERKEKKEEKKEEKMGERKKSLQGAGTTPFEKIVVKQIRNEDITIGGGDDDSEEENEKKEIMGNFGGEVKKVRGGDGSCLETRSALVAEEAEKVCH